jgi:hypothetical protein
MISRAVTTSSAHRLIISYVALEVLLDLVVLLPGGPSFAPDTSFVGFVVFEAVLVWLLWHRSRFAWVLLMFTALVTLPLMLFGTADLGSIVMTLLALAQAAVLLAPPTLSFVWSHRPTRLVAP